MPKGFCAAAALLGLSSLALADAGEMNPSQQYFPGTHPDPQYWTTPDNWPNHPPIKREWPDGPNKQFLQNLQRPDNYRHPYRDKNSQSCCDAGDTVKTKFRVEPAQDSVHLEDRWYAWLKDKWVPVPPDKIIPDYAPDGQAYLFMLSDVIVCSVRPKGGL
jgi:hypothetical protein